MSAQLAPVAALRPLGRLWGALARIRRELYEAGFFHVEKAPLPVVSVGNLTMGGNGKTPMCAFLAKALTGRGHKCAILSRGYGRARTAPDPAVASLGFGPLLPASQAGDEPFMLAMTSPAMVICARRRILAARKAAELGADVLILDDGFQHLGLHRDLDILMLRSPAPWDGGLVIPAGSLRERPETHLAADVLVALGEPPSPAIMSLAKGRPLFAASILPASLFELGDGHMGPEPASAKKLPLDYPAGSKILAFCGLANPGSFFKTLAGLDLSPAASLALPDHARYGPDDLSRLSELISVHEPDFLITTTKDAVKLLTPQSGSSISRPAPPPTLEEARLAPDVVKAALGRPMLVLQTELGIDKADDLANLISERLGLKANLIKPASHKAGSPDNPESSKTSSLSPSLESSPSPEPGLIPECSPSPRSQNLAKAPEEIP